MSLEYIRRTYGVPAKRGGRAMVVIDGRNMEGTIKSARGPHVVIALDDHPARRPKFHPTDIVYL